MKSNVSQRISIADDFSTVPMGRFPTDSDVNGTLFRESFLYPALTKYQTIDIDLGTV